MMKKITLFFAAIAVLSVASCEDPAPANVKPVITVTAGEVTETTISFTVTTEDAFAAAYICLKENDETPSAEEVLMKGKSIAVNQTVECTSKGLLDNTTYNVYVAAMSETMFVLADPISMTTTDIPPQPAAVLSAGQLEGKTFSFTITPVEAEKCAYKLYTDGQEATAEDIFTNGTEVSATEATEVELADLEKGSYFVVAAVQNGEIVTLSEELEFTVAGAASVTFTVNKVQGERYNGDTMLKIYDADLNKLFVDYYHGESEKGLPEGTYTWGYYPTSSDTPDPWKLWSAYTEMTMNDVDYQFTGGTSTITKNDDGSFTVSFDLTRDDGKVVDFSWTGQIEWTR